MENDKLSLSNEEFKKLRNFVFQSIGVNLSEAKRALVVSRLSKHIRKKGLHSFTQYLKLVEETEHEKEKLFNLITTNVTNFFREEHHFQFLINEYVPSIIDKHSKTIRVWSAACSSGEEPYSIAMTLEGVLKKEKNIDYKILASDINTEMLHKAKTGIYRHEEVVGISYDHLKTFFKLGQGENKGLFKIKENVQKKIVFQQINLVGKERYPIKDKIDIIFCRNVFIYFSKETQRFLLDRFYEQLSPEGILILGHSESIANNQDKWRLINKTIYKKI